MGGYGIEWRILAAFGIILAACAVAFAGDFARSVPEVAEAIGLLLSVFNGR